MTKNLNPPAWAQRLLTMLLPVDNADAVVGDLLEQYREAVLPARGRARASRWYVKQVAGFLWRSSGVFATTGALLLIGRALLDPLSPPGDFHFRSAVTTYSAIAIFFTAGAYGAFRTRRLISGVVNAIATHAIAHSILLLVELVVMAGATMAGQNDLVGWLTGPFGFAEDASLAILILPFAAVLGFAGAIGGKILRELTARRLAG